jgi:hypothetical protein
MTSSELRQLIRNSAARPFKVFVEGKEYHISHPEFAALTGTGRTLLILHPNDDLVDMIDVELIARVEVQTPQSH